MTDSIKYNLDNQRHALEILPQLIKNSGLTFKHHYIHDFLSSSGIYLLLPRDCQQRYDLLLHLSSLYEKIVEEYIQLYMVGQATTLIKRTWLEAEELKKSKDRNQQLEFLGKIIFDFYKTLGNDHPGLPFPYDAAPYIK